MGFCLQGTLCVAPDSCWNRQMRNVLKYSDTKNLMHFCMRFLYVTRFELATFWSVARRSIQLSYTYI